MRLPDQIHIIEVGARDGFQNINTRIPTEIKIKTIERFLAAGAKELEITSFVHPKAIPQMGDAKEVATQILRDYGDKARLFALVPNRKGFENALECGVDTVTYVISASQAHNRANVRRSIEESFQELKTLISDYSGMCVRLDIATAFGCPYSGNVREEDVLALTERAIEVGVQEIMFCDTIGAANPRQISDFCKKIYRKYPVPVGLHLHDTRGMGLANVLSAMQEGVDRFETAVGGLGGCPFAPGAAGNTATEDLLNMLDGMGVAHGYDTNTYLNAVSFVSEHIQHDLSGHVYQAMCCAAVGQREG